MSKRLIMGWFILTGVSITTEAQDSLQQVLSLNEIVVSASKIPIVSKESAKPITVISKEEIQKSRGKSLAQILNDKSGIQINGTFSNPGKNRDIFIRGASGENSLILLNGVPLQDASGLGGVFDIRSIPLEIIERIEILKGSQSTLYGSDALAGIINIITQSPSKNGISLFGQGSYGSFNTLNGTAGVSGSTRKIDYTLNLNHLSSDGISEAVSRDNSVEFLKDGFSRNGLFTSMNYRPINHLTLSPKLIVSNYDGSYDNGPFSDGENTFQSEIVTSELKADYTKDDLAVVGIYNYNNTDREFISQWGETQYLGQNQVLDLYSSYKFQNVQLIGGIYYLKSDIEDELSSIPNPNFTTFSPYLTLLLKQLKNFNGELGYRFNSHSAFGNTGTYSVAASYSFLKNFSGFGSFTTGFKSPTLNQLYGQFGPNPNLLPQKSKSIELGIENNSQNIDVGITYFSRLIDDVIIYNFATGYSNEDIQNDHGVEIDSKIRLSRNVSLNLFYNFVDGEVTSLLDQGKDTTFYNLIRRPKHRIGGDLSVTILDNFDISFEFQYNGQRDDRYFNAETFETESVVLNSYFLLNANINYSIISEKLNWFCTVRNITNVEFYESAGYSTMGFSVQTGINFKF